MSTLLPLFIFPVAPYCHVFKTKQKKKRLKMLSSSTRMNECRSSRRLSFSLLFLVSFAPVSKTS